MEQLVQYQEKMSTVDISNITGKRHDHVLRDVEKVLTELKIDLPTFGGTYKDSQNRNQKCYYLPKRECLILASGYSIILRTKIIDRWMELEKAQPKQLSRKELAYMVIEAEEKAERLQLEIDTKHKPRSEFVDKVFKSDDLISMSVVAKTLQLDFGRNILYRKLREKGILFKNTNEPKQYYVQQGYFKLKEKLITLDDGREKVALQTFVTQKGLAYIAKVFGVVQIPYNPVQISA